MRAIIACLLVWAWLGAGCSSYADQLRDARAALDRGEPAAALAVYNDRLEVDRADQLPDDLKGDKVLYVLERSLVLQSMGNYALSSRDLEVADKRVEVLDFEHSSADDIAKFMFSDASGPYQSPAYEKLMINTLNMINYLARGDLNGARVEARRLAVMQTFIRDRDPKHANVGAVGSYLAGFTFERSRQPGEALQFYSDALEYGEFPSLAEPVARLAQYDAYRSPRLRELLATQAAPKAADNSAEVLIVVGYGRVPVKVAQRIPIGAALVYAGAYLAPEMLVRANQAAAQGLVTWINFPTLPAPRPSQVVPEIVLDQRQVAIDHAVAVDALAVDAWNENKARMIASAVTRLVTRVATGEVARRAAGKGLFGMLASLGAQATLTALDTPDTRSWSTLPAHITLARVRVPPGTHVIDIAVSGEHKRQQLTLTPGGWAVVNLTALH